MSRPAHAHAHGEKAKMAADLPLRLKGVVPSGVTGGVSFFSFFILFVAGVAGGSSVEQLATLRRSALRRSVFRGDDSK